MRKPSDARLLELAEILNDHDRTAPGPLDSHDLRAAVVELLDLRKEKKQAKALASDPMMGVQL